METLRFTFPEILSLFGVFQCVYIIVYVLFRTVRFSHVILPILYFFVLGSAFFLDFAHRTISDYMPAYDVFVWVAWNLVLPLGVLLIVQMARISKLPPLPVWGVLIFVPLAFLGSYGLSVQQGRCTDVLSCVDFKEWLEICGLIAGACSLLVIWTVRGLFSDLLGQKAGRERYWLILSLVVLDIFYLAAESLRLGGGGYDSQAVLLRTLLGLAFCYIVTTSLFRIYPQALILADRQKSGKQGLDDGEVDIAHRIQELLDLQKVYHEPTYSRTDMARELGVSESVISRVINVHFQKSLPQILNEKRVGYAKQLLLDTDASIKVIASEVGFNSLPSFNRAFKEVEGRSPSDYRKNMVK